MSHLPADFYRKLEDGLIVGRAYPATGCAPLGPPPIQAIVGAGLPTAANMPDAHSEMLRLLELSRQQAAEIERLRAALMQAREWIVEQRDALAECHTGPDGIDELGAKAVAEDDALIAAIDAAMKQAQR